MGWIDVEGVERLGLAILKIIWTILAVVGLILTILAILSNILVKMTILLL